MAWTKTFRESYLERFQCDSDKFEEDLLRRALHRRSLPLAWFVRTRMPSFFELEFRTIRYLGSACSSQEFSAELDDYRSECRKRGGVLRRIFALRLSGKRLIGLVNAVAPQRAKVK